MRVRKLMETLGGRLRRRAPGPQSASASPDHQMRNEGGESSMRSVRSQPRCRWCSSEKESDHKKRDFETM